MKKTITSILVLSVIFIFIFIISGCSNGGGLFSQGPATDAGYKGQTGSVSFKFGWPQQKASKWLPPKYFSSGTASISVSITGDGLSSAYTTTVTYTAGTTTNVTISGLPTGAKTGIITALDASGNILTAGISNFTVETGRSSTAIVGMGILITDTGFIPSTFSFPLYTNVNFYNIGTRYHEVVSSSGALIPGLIAPGSAGQVTFYATGSATYYLDNTSSGITCGNTITAQTGPQITTISPSGQLPGQSVTITGTGFGATQNTSTVTFAGYSATITSWSNTSIVCTLPQGAVGTGMACVITVAYETNKSYYTNAAPNGTDKPNPWFTRAGVGIGDGYFQDVRWITGDTSDYLYIVDSTNSRVQKFYNTYYFSKWGSNGTGAGQFDAPYGITVNSTLNLVYVTDSNNDRVQMFNNSGTYLGVFGSAGTGNGQFNEPTGIDRDSNGNVYVVDRLNQRIQKFNENGVFISKWGPNIGGGDPPATGYSNFHAPYGIAIDRNADNLVYILDNNANRVIKFDSSGNYIIDWGNNGAGNGQFSVNGGACNLCVDPSGVIYVADWGNNRIQKFSSAGTYLTSWTQSDFLSSFDKPNTVYVTSSYTVITSDVSDRLQFFTYGTITPNQ